MKKLKILLRINAKIIIFFFFLSTKDYNDAIENNVNQKIIMCSKTAGKKKTMKDYCVVRNCL